MARKARAALADLRALEEQNAAANPVAPSRRRKAVKGAGATPSTGLSQFRGGRARKMPSLKMEELKMPPSLHNAMEDEMALMPSGEYDGAGKHSLFDHLAHPMKGFGDYLHAMDAGMKTGKYEGEGATPSMGLSQFRGGATTAQKEKAGREYRIASLKAHKLAHKALSLEGGMAMGQVVGSGKLTITHGDDSASASDEEMEGCGPAPAGKKKRAPAGPDDGRRKRAAVVRKVMADKGLSMIEASKYVKAHGLYKP